jgi:phosphoribosylaminoimidazole-succinocarboxamide synthase
MNKGELLYSGKAKSVYRTNDENLLILHFRDDTSAFDGKKVEKAGSITASMPLLWKN